MLSSLSGILVSAAMSKGPVSNSAPSKVDTAVTALAVASLYASGINLIGHDIDFMTPQKAKSLTFLNNIRRLHGAGLQVASTADMWMEPSGSVRFELDRGIFPYLTFEKGTNEHYINTLLMLHKAGYEVNWFFVKNFSIEQSKDAEYVQSLING